MVTQDDSVLNDDYSEYHDDDDNDDNDDNDDRLLTQDDSVLDIFPLLSRPSPSPQGRNKKLIDRS